MIKRVDKVLEKAERSEDGVGLGRKNKIDGKEMYSHKYTRATQAAEYVYKAERFDGRITLFHYGTKIVTIDRYDSDNASATIHEGAYSKSDQDAINTALNRYDIDKWVKRSKGDIWLE